MWLTQNQAKVYWMPVVPQVGKPRHLAQLMHDQGEIQAFDIHAHKLELIDQLALRMGITIIQAQLGDARDLPGVKLGSTTARVSRRSLFRFGRSAPESGSALAERRTRLVGFATP